MLLFPLPLSLRLRQSDFTIFRTGGGEGREAQLHQRPQRRSAAAQSVALAVTRVDTTRTRRMTELQNTQTHSLADGWPRCCGWRTDRQTDRRISTKVAAAVLLRVRCGPLRRRCGPCRARAAGELRLATLRRPRVGGLAPLAVTGCLPRKAQ